MDNRQYRPNLLDVPVSIFRQAFDTVPECVTTLRRMVETKYYQETIEAIRAEPDQERQKELKKQLRAFTPVALLHHRKEGTPLADKISQQWPLLMGDVDKKDNPGVDMSELKHHLCRLPYVLLCAYSVRGGLWFVVRLPNQQTPDTLAAHFRYLQQLFGERLGVQLDKSKGGNPTHLRYVSYDAAPYFDENATVMHRTYTPPPPKPQPLHMNQFPWQDDGQLLNRLVRFTETAVEGNRHETLLKAAITAGGYIAAGRIDEQTAVYGLETVASEWPTFSKSQRTIRDGIRYGMTKPIYTETDPLPTRPANDWPSRLQLGKMMVPTAKPHIGPLAVSRIENGPALEEREMPLPMDSTTVEIDPAAPLPVATHRPSDCYPDDWDAPNPPDAVPTIRPKTFSEWQRQQHDFSRLGLDLINTKTDL